MAHELFVLDSISQLTPAMGGAIVVSGSPGGLAAAQNILALPIKPYAVILNDAGIGKDDAGIVGLLLLEQAGVIGATCSHQSARLGDAADSLDHGVLSRVNGAAMAAGLRGGLSVAAALERLVKVASSPLRALGPGSP